MLAPNLYENGQLQNAFSKFQFLIGQAPKLTMAAMDDDTKKKLVFGAKCTGGALVAVGLATTAVPVLGFGVAGVKAGTAAAAAQSMIGNVAAGSVFASLQSAGVLGLATGTKVAIGAAGAAGTAYLA